MPGLRSKVHDGGYDDDAYWFIRLMIDYVYPGEPEPTVLGSDFGLTAIPMLGLGTFLETPEDEAARTMGHDVTMYIAQNYDVTMDDYASSLRLRSLALGYDFFFANAPDSDRVYVREEMVDYMSLMITSMNYEAYKFRPYLGNRSAMIASSLGLAAICLADEIDAALVDGTLEFADEMISEWLGFQVDGEGAYNEGALYAAWSLRHLVYYFAARELYDGFSYGNSKVKKMENWFVYELLPEGNGKTNNLNDSSYGDDPLPQHHTYFDWAQSEWGSALSAYLYEHTAGPYGWDWGPKADKTATALWNKSLAPKQPGTVLPRSHVWEDRGLYYFRTGWPAAGESSDDVVFSFYSGLFQGAHAQEDQNQFTLTGYGAKFAIDHGPGGTGKQSESHNIVFIDGKGQHNAGGSIGTDGRITHYLLSDFADFVQGDATAAYTTYSPLNRPGYPFRYSDWSWGYDGGNPVDFAYRNVLVVHDIDTIPPYFLIYDDVEKDGLAHNYHWRLHTASANTVDTSGYAARVSSATGFMDVHVLNPPAAAVSTSIVTYNNMSTEPDAKLISFATTAVNPNYVVLLVPADGSVTDPSVAVSHQPWGLFVTIGWSARTDVVAYNFSGGTMDFTVTGLPSLAERNPPAGSARAASTVSTNAATAILRFGPAGLERYGVARASSLIVDGLDLVTVSNGDLSACLSGSTIYIDRYDADFSFYAPSVTEIKYHEQQIYFSDSGGYLSPDPTLGARSYQPPRRSLGLSAHPNPFNPSTTVSFTLDAQRRVTALVYDPAGRLVRRLVDTVFPAGSNTLMWDGTNNSGRQVASGVYFLLLTDGSRRETVKLTVLK